MNYNWNNKIRHRRSGERIKIVKIVSFIFFFGLVFLVINGFSVFAQANPNVMSFGPSGQQSGVNQAVYAAFDSDMEPNSINANTFKVTVEGSVYLVPGSFYYDSNSHTATFLPASSFRNKTKYNVVLTTSITDKLGQNLAEQTTWSFTTGMEFIAGNPHGDYLLNSNACASCHSTHSAVASNLLNQSDQTTLCLTCHDGTGSIYNTIETFQPVGVDWTAHPVEKSVDNTVFEFPIQCSDCHNPHGTSDYFRTVRNRVYSGLLIGVSGVEVNWFKVLVGTVPDPDPASYNFLKLSNSVLEADICMKCHSNYNPNLASNKANQAIEFNPGNLSAHPIYGSGTNSYTNSATMEPPFNQNTNEHTLLKCTDCHGASTNALTFNGDTSVQNMHGSTNLFILKKPADSNDLCLLCHKRSVYIDGGAGSRFAGNVYSSVYATVYGYDSNFPYKPEVTTPLHQSHTLTLKCINCHGGTVNTSINGTNVKTNVIHGTYATYGNALMGNAAPASSDNKIQHFLISNGITGITGWKVEGNNATCYTSGCHNHPAP